MPYSVSSSFNYLRQQYAPAGFQRQFLIGSSDYTDRVTKWPSFSIEWDNPKSQTATLSLSNEDDALGFFRSDPTNMQQDCVVKMGFNGELISLFTGKVNAATYGRGALSLRLEDKLKVMGKRIIGSAAAPVVYSGGGGTPVSSFVWSMVTSYGGLSSVRSAANPDVDWDAFVSWATVFSTSGVFVEARIEGITAIEMLRKIARLTDSAIFLRENKLYFKRFSIADSNQVNLTPEILTDYPSLVVDDDDIINRFHTLAAYVPDSRYWLIDALSQSSASVNSFGLREQAEKDSVLWHVGSTSALDLSQRKVLTAATPPKRVKASTSMLGVVHLVGEMFTLADPGLGLSGETFRIMGIQVDLNQCDVTLNGDSSQVFGGFTLDTSSLNGVDVLL